MTHYFQPKIKQKQFKQRVNLCSSLRSSVCKKGFTLIELLLYMSILIIVLLFIGEYLYSMGQARLNNSIRVEVAHNAQFVMTKISSEIVKANSISVPSDNNPSSFLSLTMPEEHIVNFSLENGSIKVIYDSQISFITSNLVKVSNLTFQKIGNLLGKETIQIKFTIQSIGELSGKRTVSESFQTTAARR